MELDGAKDGREMVGLDWEGSLSTERREAALELRSGGGVRLECGGLRAMKHTS